MSLLSIYMTINDCKCQPLFQDFIALKAFHFLVIPYVHVLGLVLAHVAVITLSDAPIAGYNLTNFSR